MWSTQLVWLSGTIQTIPAARSAAGIGPIGPDVRPVVDWQHRGWRCEASACFVKSILLMAACVDPTLVEYLKTTALDIRRKRFFRVGTARCWLPWSLAATKIFRIPQLNRTIPKNDFPAAH